MLGSSYLKEGVIELIELRLIKRSKFNLRDDLYGIEELIESIKIHGLLQPLIVRPAEGYFELITGSRRLEALKRLRWRKAPCITVDVDDKTAYEIALIENLQRETLDPIEEATAFKKYVEEYGWGSVTELARRIGKSQEYVSQRLRLLKLPDEIKDLIRQKRLAPSAARELLQLPKNEDRITLGRLAAERRYSVRRIKEIIEDMKSSDLCESLTLESPLKDRYKIIEKAIVVVRTAMIKIDSLIEESSKDDEVRELLFSKRLALHSILDSLIKYKLRIEKGLRREGIL